MLHVFMAAFLSQAGATAVPGVQVQDEGTSQGQVTKLNFTGSGVSCSRSGSTGTCNVNSGGSISFTTVEIDFGSVAGWTEVTTIVDASVSSTSKVTAWQAGNAATSRQADENEMDQLTCVCIPGSGSFTLICTAIRSVTHGLFKIHYTVG